MFALVAVSACRVIAFEAWRYAEAASGSDAQRNADTETDRKETRCAR
jgi:hypothetical protein